MREHLYRGKRVDNGEWVYGYLVEKTDFDSGLIAQSYIIEIEAFGRTVDYDTRFCDIEEIEVLTETICEYIGRTDGNGKKIFEGDILDDRDNKPHYVIVFDNGCFKVPSVRSYKEENFYTETADEFYFPIANVIGNIYDNPELLADET